MIASCPAQKPTLRTIQIPVGAPILDTAMSDLNGDGQDDLVVLTKNRELRFFLQEKGATRFRKVGSQALPAGTAAWAVADVVAPPGDELVLLSATGLQIITIQGDGKPGLAHYLDLPLIFPVGYRGEPRFWGWGEDLDGDPWSDLLLPGLEGDVVAHGRGSKATIEKLVPIPTPTAQALQPDPSGAVGLRRRRPRVAFHPVIKKGSASPVYMDDAGLRVLEGSLRTGFPGRSRMLFPIRKTEGNPLDILQRLDVTLEDLNRDGLSDLVLARTRADTSSRSFEQRTQLLFFLNSKTPTARPAQIIMLAGVLSNGPHLLDVNGDGRKDLFFSVYGGKLSSNIARLVLRNVRLQYHLYLGAGETDLFPHSPDHTFVDKVPLGAFDTWNLRHRLFLQSDWNQDGMLDLVRIKTSDEDVVIDIIPSSRKNGAVEFAKTPLVRFPVQGSFEGYTHQNLGKAGPAILLTGKESLTLVTR